MIKPKLYDKNPISYFWIYLLLSVLCRWPSLFIPYVDIDEVLWGLTANAIVDGHPPYQEVMGEKPPLLYLSYAAIFSLFGKHNYFAMHVFGIIWMALTSLVIAHLVKRFAGSKTAFFAGAAYIFFGSASGFRMLATTGELMMNLFLVGSTLVFLIGFEEKNYGKIFAAGALATLAGMFRQQSLIQIGAYVGFLAFVFFTEETNKKRAFQFFKMSVSLVFGCFVIVAVCLFYVHHSGAMEDFYLWVIKHNYFYIKSGFANDNVLRNFTRRTGLVLATTLPLWLLAAKRIKFALANPRWPDITKRHFEILIWLYLIVSLIAVTPGGRFFPHYFLQAFPPLCILATLELFEPRQRSSRFFLGLTSFYAVLVLCNTPLIFWEMTINDKGDYSDANRIVGEYIKEKTTAQDRIFIWGWAQGIYYYSGRDPAARFISTDFLTGRSPSQNDELDPDTSANITPGSWDMLFKDFKKHKPTYILDTTPGNYHGYSIYPLHEFQLLSDFIRKNYSFEKQIEGVDLYRIQNKE